jgi:hypothetical protein
MADVLGAVGKGITTQPGGGIPDVTSDPTRLGSLY